MLSAIRAFAKSPFATGLLGLLVVSFGVWGIKDVFRSGGFTDAVVKAGSRPPITSAQFKDIFAAEKAQREQQAGQQVSNEQAVKLGLDRMIADGLAATEASGALMASEGIKPSDDLIAGEIRKITAFFSPITGQFDKDTYVRALAEKHLTEAQADNEFRDTVAQRHYIAGLAAGLKAPRIYGLVQAAFAKEGRDFTWFALGPSAVPAPTRPTDDQLNGFLKQNAAQLTKPEQRQLSIVRFSAAKLATTIAAPDDLVQKRFAFEKDTLNVPEKRAMILISVKDAAAGAQAAAKLKAGGDPQTIAKAAGGQATTYPATPKAAIADPKIADAAFGLKPGEVAGPIQGTLGLAVIKLLDITPAKPVTLAEARPKIEAEVKQQQAKEKIYDVVQKYDDAHSGGAGMADAAKAAGVAVEPIPVPLISTGQTLMGQKANLPPKVLQAAFTLPQGGDSEVLDIGQGEYWVVHVDKVIPPALLTLDESVPQGKVRDLITKQFVLRDLFTKLRAKSDALTAEIKKGKTMEAAAAEVGATLQHADNVDRTASNPKAQGAPPAYSQDLLGRVFAGKIGDVVVGEDTKPGLIVAKLDKVEEAPAPILAGLAEQARMPTTRALFEDIGAATRLAAVSKMKPTVDYKKGRDALGVESDAGAAPAKPKS